jgi:hypothetical protein
MSNPIVTQGPFMSGAIFVYNASTPGTIKIALISATKTFPGSGDIATIDFGVPPGPGNITIDSISMIDSQGHTL